MNSGQEILNKVIAIQNYGSSGTKLLQSLFDGHPEVLSLPSLYTRELFRFWEENAPFQSREDLVTKFVSSPYHAYWFDADPTKYKVLIDNGLMTLGPHANENLQIDRTRYMLHLSQALELAGDLTLKNLVVCVYRAYAAVKKQQIHSGMWILFPIHSNPKRYADQLIDIFDEVRFVHMVREPVTSTYSMVNHLIETKNPHSNIFSAAIKQVILDIPHHAKERAYGLEPYATDSNKMKSVAVRLEDIHSQPKKTLAILCDWLAIKWDDCLLASTFDGKLWNNGMGSIKHSGFSKEIIKQKYPKYADRFDYLRLGILSHSHRLAFKYEKNAWLQQKLFMLVLPILLLFPFKAEKVLLIKQEQRLKNYMETRATLFKAYCSALRDSFKFVKLLN
jgi:hypothetical protein